MFKEGDWCFCEFQLVQIKEMKDNQVKEVTDGYIEHGGNLTEECFPLNFEVVYISEKFRDYWKAITKTRHPQIGVIHSSLIRQWIECCQKRDDEQEVFMICKLVEDLVKRVQKAVELDI